ncbi:hypothetical protein [Heyndrickxia camelliae]|uniref:Uncharacterized protein n=1 Tax=Heyndrickxia camelliae TaxID=1707093 RepID=A0A2N3LH86_9BACI|nr:hypothetical protein [Heyndrickxia camelliae]PKR83992.1 hypothetical protein CWO92_15845 [Heyndrickxia camelliae]
MKKIIFSIASTLLLLGAIVLSSTKSVDTAAAEKEPRLFNTTSVKVAAAEKEPRLFSTYSVSFFSFES